MSDDPKEPGGTADREEIRPEILAFVRRMTLAGSVERYDVKHAIAGSGTQHVGTVPAEFGASDDDIARRVQDVLYEDAEGLTGPQVYTILCFQIGKTAYFMRRHVKLFSPGTEGEYYEGPVMSEPSNVQGLLAQSQRHVEVLMRLGVDALMGLRRENTRDHERALRRVEHLEDQRDVVAQRMHEVSMAQNEQDLRILKAKREDRQDALIGDMINLMAPAMIGKLLPGGSVGAPPRNEDLLRDFILDISPKQMQQILPHLNPAQVAAMNSLIEAFKAGKTPSFGDVTTERFLESLQPSQTEALDAILRPEQIEQLQKIAASYWEAREKQKGAASSSEAAPSGSVTTNGAN